MELGLKRGGETLPPPISYEKKGVELVFLIEGEKRFQDDVKEVRAGLQCGIKLGDFTEYLPEDIIECYTLEKVPQHL